LERKVVARVQRGSWEGRNSKWRRESYESKARGIFELKSQSRKSQVATKKKAANEKGDLKEQRDKTFFVAQPPPDVGGP